MQWMSGNGCIRNGVIREITALCFLNEKENDYDR